VEGVRLELECLRCDDCCNNHLDDAAPVAPYALFLVLTVGLLFVGGLVAFTLGDVSEDEDADLCVLVDGAAATFFPIFASLLGIPTLVFVVS
jgi:hypothetical protein